MSACWLTTHIYTCIYMYINMHTRTHTQVLSPFSSKRRCQQYQMLEVTPLYIGQAQTSTQVYTPLYSDTLHRADNHTHPAAAAAASRRGPLNRSIGGYIEPYAFGAPPPPPPPPQAPRPPMPSTASLPAGVTEGQLASRAPPIPFGLANVTAASSFAPGMAFSLIPGVDAVLQLAVEYWSPASPIGAAAAEGGTHGANDAGGNAAGGDGAGGNGGGNNDGGTGGSGSGSGGGPAAATHEPFLLADGGDYENIHLIGMLKRRVERIVLFINTDQPLHGSSVWDPTTTKPNTKYIEDMFPTFFGVAVAPGDAVEKIEQEIADDYSCNAVFNSSEFVPLVVAMQAKQDAGEPVVVSTALTTVQNEHWGVPAGIEVQVTWVYLSRVGAWEELLPAATKELVVPKNQPSPVDYGVEIASG